MTYIGSQSSAIRALALLQQQIKVTDKRLATGVKVADLVDSTSMLRQAKEASARLAALARTRTSLSAGMAAVSSSSNATASVASALSGIRALLTAAKASGADLASIQSRIAALNGSIRSSVSAASFEGNNLLATSSVRSFQASASGYSIAIDTNLTRMLDGVGGSGILQSTFALTPGAPPPAPKMLGLSGTASSTDGVASQSPSASGLSGTAASTAGLAADAAAPAVTGLSGTATAAAGVASATPSTSGLSGTASTVAGVASRSATAARIVVGTRDSAAYGKGDVEHLTVTLDGTTKTLNVRQHAVSSKATLEAELQRAADEQFGNGTLTADVDAGGVMSLAVAAGAHSLSLDGTSVTDGDEATTSTLGIQTSASYGSATTSIGGQTRAYDDIGSPSAAGMDKTDRLSFVIWGKLSNGSQGSITATVKVADIVDAGTGAPTSAKLATALDAAINAAGGGSYFGATTLNGNVIVYHEQSGAQVRLGSVTAVNGDGDTSKTLGFITASASGADAVSAVQASVTTGSDFAATTVKDDATLKFDLSSGGTTRTLTIAKATVDAALAGESGYVAGSGAIATADRMALVVGRAIADAGLSAYVSATAVGDRIRFTKLGTPSDGDSIVVSNVAATSSTTKAATLDTGSDFAGPRTIDAGKSIDFVLAVDGVSRNVSVTKADVESALSGRAGHVAGSGTIADATELALVVQAATTRAGASGVSVSAVGDHLRFAKSTAGTGSLAISGVAGRSAATNAVAVTGSDFASSTTLGDDATIAFDLSLDGGSATRVTIARATVETALAGVPGRTSGTGTVASVSELATVAQRALTEAGVSGVVVGTQGDRLTFTRSAAGTGSVSMVNAQVTASTPKAAFATTGSDFSDPVTIAAGASLAFDLSIDGGSTTRVTIDRSTVTAALAGSATIADAGDLASVVRRALAEANIAGVDVAAVGQRLKLSKSSAGTGRVAIGNVAATAAPAPATPTVRIGDLDVASTAFRSLGTTERGALIDDYVRNLDAIAAKVAGAADHLRFVGGQMASQDDFMAKLQDIQAGYANSAFMADMDEEKARKAALEARLALVRTSMSIVNQSRANVLLLFRDRNDR